jgi:3-hydroxyisobutyrate dehydrogenase
MTRIAFIGLGNMGGGMAARQMTAGRELVAFDLSEVALQKAVNAGARRAASVSQAVGEADVVITMLPAGPHVRRV